MGRTKPTTEAVARLIQMRIDRALDYRIRTDGMSPTGEYRIVTRRELVDRCFAEGRRVKIAANGERRLTHEDGRFFDERAIGKAAMDYAERLAAKAGSV